MKAGAQSRGTPGAARQGKKLPVPDEAFPWANTTKDFRAHNRLALIRENTRRAIAFVLTGLLTAGFLGGLHGLGQDVRGGSLGGADHVGINVEGNGRVRVAVASRTTWTGTAESNRVVACRCRRSCRRA